MLHFASLARLFLWSTILALYHARYKGALDISQSNLEVHLAAIAEFLVLLGEKDSFKSMNEAKLQAKLDAEF